MKNILLFVFIFTCSMARAQESRNLTPTEQATHALHLKTLPGKWKTTTTEIGIVEAQLKPKSAELKAALDNVFANARWEFSEGGKFSLTIQQGNDQVIQQGTFTIAAQFLTLFIDGKTHRCRMKVETDGTVIIHFPVTQESIYAMQLSKP